MTNLYDIIEGIIMELEGLGGAAHFHENGMYEDLRRIIYGTLADYPTMAPATALALGEALGCFRHGNLPWASYELETLLNQMGEASHATVNRDRIGY